MARMTGRPETAAEPATAARPLRLAVAGCGRVVERFHLPALARVPEMELVAACDPDASARSAAQAWPSRPAVFESVGDLLHGARLDALLVATPPDSHAAVAVGALETGLHVLVEKPLALTVGEGRRMADAARTAGRRLQVGFNRRFRDPYLRLRAALEPVAPERIRNVRFELSFPVSGWGARTGFLGRPELGGGVLDDVLSHQVDILWWVLGLAPEAARLAAQGGRPSLGAGSATVAQTATPSQTTTRAQTTAATGDQPGGGVEPATEVELRLAGGMLARCRASHGPFVEWLEVALDDERVWTASASRAFCARGARSAWRRRRALAMDRVALVTTRLARRPGVTLESFQRQLRDFARAALGGEAEGAGPEDGLRALAVAAACRESAGGGGSWRQVAF